MGKRLTHIATRTGDDGTTGLGNNTRISKASARMRAIGDADELNSHIGLLLCEEKDTLREEYALVHLSKADYAALDPAAVVGSRATPYGVSAVVRRDALPAGLAVEPVSIEDLFVLMAKEGEK